MGISLFLTDTQNTKYTTKRVEGKKTNKHGLGLAPGQEGEVCDTFQAFCELSQTCILAKLPQSHQECWFIFSRWPTRLESIHPSSRLLSPADCLVPSTGLFCLLLCSAALGRLLWSLLFTSVDSRTFLPSSFSGLMGNLTSKRFVWVSRKNRQRNLLTST